MAPPSEKRSYCVMLKSMLINDSSISIEFTENKITDTVEISESHSLWSYLFKQIFDMAPHSAVPRTQGDDAIRWCFCQ